MGSKRYLVAWAAVAAVFATTAFTGEAHAQTTPPPERSSGWATVSDVSLLLGATSQLAMPRVYYAETETTVGWKARWHASVLASLMTLTAASLTNEYVLKDEFAGYRPGCDETNQGGPGCTSYGAPSTHAFASFSALGHGTGVFLVDTLKWNDGRFHGGAFTGEVAFPFLAAGFTAVGRIAGEPNHESRGQVLAGAGMGLGVGLLTGIMYSLMQRPECGYGSGMICW